jgi:hypothetical protein
MVISSSNSRVANGVSKRNQQCENGNWRATLMQLTMVELIDEQTTCVRQCIGTMRKTPRRIG